MTRVSSQKEVPEKPETPGLREPTRHAAPRVGSSGRHARGGPKEGKRKRKGSLWRELPLLILAALVLTFLIQTFLARIYEIPSASMEKTLIGCSGCTDDRVLVDKITYRFTDPKPGDVVVFRGPASWGEDTEFTVARSSNVILRGLQQAASLIGLAPPDEMDFVKRVIAVGGQTVQCCDQQNRVLVDGKPLNEPYIYYQPGLGTTQAPFGPVTVPPGELWMMGDNRNNSADSRAPGHGAVPKDDVIGKARFVVLPPSRWGIVGSPDPQQSVAMSAPGWERGAPVALGFLIAWPSTRALRRLRRPRMR